MRQFYIELPLPTSVNAMYVGVRRNYSKPYKKWRVRAGEHYRNQFGVDGVPVSDQLTGRLSFQITLIEVTKLETRDVDNYIKAAQDFLQAKFYENDKQIDEPSGIRRYSKVGRDRVKIWVTEIPDRRWIDLFNPEDVA